MFGFLFKKIFGSKNERYLRRLRPQVQRINALEPEMQQLDDADFAARIARYKEEVQEGGKSLDSLLPEVFALVREASRRVLGMRHYDVQLVGGMVLHKGKIAEMKTGEGKTLVATLAVVLNALSGKGVHVVTVNDYLASRDAAWMGKLYSFLGLSTGVIVHGLDDDERKTAYNADITYGTNNEFGFDYLRDNMKFYAEQLVQRGHNFAIVDEVDSILIDEARTPLIISGASEESVGMYRTVDDIVRQLTPEHFTIDEKARTAMLTDAGVLRCEELLKLDNLFDPANITAQHHVLQSLKAHQVFKRDVDYIVQDDQVVIVDEFTGRLMAGRRYSDGLHQALEAKEHVTVAAENQTLASITFQNYFRLYDKLSGMTGTADTEAVEFQQIYNLEVISIPPNKPMVRRDHPDLIFRSRKEKFDAIVEAIAELHQKEQPVLVGTISIETSEMLSQRLTKLGIPHNVLNAKQHEKEAEIVAQAGQKGKVTIATNMAGRGTDIVLGDGVVDLGGLHILGTERHESRRIDNQLRGRAGRQGDPGSSQFFISMEDDLLRIFGGERMKMLSSRLGMDEDTPLDAKLLTSQIENAQKRMESRNYEIRKHVLQYDDVMNQQRELIYKQRRQVLEGENVHDNIVSMIEQLIEGAVAHECSNPDPALWQLDSLAEYLGRLCVPPTEITGHENELRKLNKDQIKERLLNISLELYRKREEHLTAYGHDMRELERAFLLHSVDRRWMDHIDAMDQLRDGIGLRAFAQRDPINEYKMESYDMFEDMVRLIREDTVRLLFLAHIEDRNAQRRRAVAAITGTNDVKNSSAMEKAAKSSRQEGARPVMADKKPGRNDPCPCGSGKKYKNCCGRNE